MTSNFTCTVVCTLPCATCSYNNATNCTSCIAGYNYNSYYNNCSAITSCNGACSVCPIGYILQFGQCLFCNTDFCQVCLSNNTCLICQVGYILNGNGQCVQCSQGCASCVNSYQCTSCVQGYTSYYNINLYYYNFFNGQQCVPCQYPCQNCYLLPTSCVSCVNGYTLTGWTCTQNFFFNFTVTFNANISVFNQNYGYFILALANSAGSSNPDVVTINIINGSTTVNGAVAPIGGSGTASAHSQYEALDSLLSTNSQISGMTIISSSITV